MRLFTALELNSKVIANLTELVRRIRPVAPIRWVHPQNMHVTLKYIGEWPAHRLEEVIRALNQVKQVAPLNVPLAGLGFFPNARSPRIFWAGAENTTALRQLASSIDSTLQPLGIPPEVRPYQPHLTLGRINDNGPFTELDQAIEDLPSREFGTINPDRFVLFESTPARTGSIYRKVAEFTFAGQGQGSKEPVAAVARALTAGTL